MGYSFIYCLFYKYSMKNHYSNNFRYSIYKQIKKYYKMNHNALENIIILNFTCEFIQNYLIKHDFNNLHELFQRIDNNETIGTEVLDILSHFNSVVFQIERESDKIDYISATPNAHDITIVLQFASGHWTPKYKYNNKTIQGPLYVIYKNNI
jgi:hypothetical protein